VVDAVDRARDESLLLPRTGQRFNKCEETGDVDQPSSATNAR
jgi:hypothetical protein